MTGFPTGVAVLTSRDAGGRPQGMTCSSLCSVALDPPTLLVCVRRGSTTLTAMLGSGAFAVNLLHTAGRRAAELFASSASERFGQVPWRQGAVQSGPHLIEDAHTVADCAVGECHAAGDHVVVFGEVRAVTRLSDRAPLLYGQRRYAGWPAPGADSLCE
ncbi:flavin reductase [Nocardia seriolae]|nr:flavin reductase [Nocardia seriolae]MTJ86530.1 flavin reductase [Nocardia seriolae]MTK30525.1 flavin reductase [Nocardia seriolae]MTK39471.1 flavin reductase [Nocardia seriolae]MTK47094.1 flavin reductase [Nocardia seriolae]